MNRKPLETLEIPESRKLRERAINCHRLAVGAGVPIAKPLSPGTYDVDWHAVSVDTHRVNGHFSFKVAQ